MREEEEEHEWCSSYTKVTGDFDIKEENGRQLSDTTDTCL